MKACKLTIILFLVGVAAMSASSQSNVYSQNIVGYINRPILPGGNLVANQLNHYLLHGPLNNSINAVLTNVADGATFTKWDSAANTFLPLSVFDQSSRTWSINYNFNLGEGALVHATILETNTFVGEVAI
jgi:hypothetical protein